MFRRKTVFILGAGASWHYGYPTGEQLNDKVVKAANLLANSFIKSETRAVSIYPNFVLPSQVVPTAEDDIKKPWTEAIERCLEFVERMKNVGPLVIDYFLGQNPSLQELGKLLICWVIMDAETRNVSADMNLNRPECQALNLKACTDRTDDNEIDPFRDKWHRFILHKLLTSCRNADDLLHNEVTFISFNYDLSLEFMLQKALLSIDLLKHSDAVRQFFDNGRFIHCYGTIRDRIDATSVCSFDYFDREMSEGEKLGGNRNTRYDTSRKNILDQIFLASQRLKTIGPSDKDSSCFDLAHKKAAEAEIIYILGYGFDENNSSRLGLKQALGHNKKQRIMFTNYGDNNRINKKASRLLTDVSTRFLSPQSPLYERPMSQGYIEKSTRTVYEAFSADFDELEDD